MDRWIVITGVPATGKTLIGDMLARQYGFNHINFESSTALKNFYSNPTSFVDELQGKDIVITWGFVPNDHQISLVLYLKERGFKLIWFDGNRVAAYREFMMREKNSESHEWAFHIQMARIFESKVINRIQPIVINSFNDMGQFRLPEDIANQVVKTL